LLLHSLVLCLAPFVLFYFFFNYLFVVVICGAQCFIVFIQLCFNVGLVFFNFAWSEIVFLTVLCAQLGAVSGNQYAANEFEFACQTYRY
jgi:Na+/pantothenate symporter